MALMALRWAHVMAAVIWTGFSYFTAFVIAPATAKVVELSTKGGGLNDNPKIDFELDVTREGEPSFRAQVSVIVSLLAIPRVQPGCEIDVRIDPHDRSKVVIDEKLTYLGYTS
jgi:hypothetical protein